MSNRRALLIGIAQYDHYSNLPVDIIVHDINELKRVLGDGSNGGFDEIIPLLDKEATIKEIRYELNKLVDKCEEDDTVLIYFSGHGLGNSLMPVEYNIEKDEPKLSDQELSELLNKIKSDKVIVILDACHSGNAIYIPNKAGIQSDSFESYFDDKSAELLKGSGRIILTSSRGNQPSYILPGDSNSVFTKHLIRALDGDCVTKNDQYITVLDVYKYLSKKVDEDARSKNRKQNPMLKAEIDVDFKLKINPNYPKKSYLCDIEDSLYGKGFIEIPVEVINELLSNNLDLSKDDVFDIINKTNEKMSNNNHTHNHINIASLNDANLNSLLRDTIKEAKRGGGKLYFAFLSVLYTDLNLSSESKKSIKIIMEKLMTQS